MRVERGVGDRAALDALLERRAAVDGREPLSEHKALRVGRTGYEWVAIDREIIGYAHAAFHSPGDSKEHGHWAVELVVDAAGDMQHVGPALIEAVLSGVPGVAPLTVWAWHNDGVRLAMDAGWKQIRALHQMIRPLPIRAEIELVQGVEIRPFVPGVDDGAWLVANNAAFVDHPENGALDQANLATRLDQSWFDPGGFLLAWQGDRLFGFCWTKLHDDAIGEIYIIGVVPAAQGMGLGRALVLAGLADLGGRQGAKQAMLYVAEEDTRALTLYRKLGFEVSFTNREFLARPPI